jgi:hypothetical protein
MEEQNAAGLRMNRQNSAAFGSEEGISTPRRGLFAWSRRKYPEAGTLSQSDPTDHALAAIASILDQPEPHREPEIAVVEQKPAGPEPIKAHGYSKTGPGPMEAIRFKWTVRHQDDGEYYVDETIGENSRPIVSGPMSRDAAIKLVDDRESEARRRFEQLKGEMTGRNPVPANLAWKNSGEM